MTVRSIYRIPKCHTVTVPNDTVTIMVRGREGERERGREGERERGREGERERGREGERERGREGERGRERGGGWGQGEADRGRGIYKLNHHTRPALERLINLYNFYQARRWLIIQ